MSKLPGASLLTPALQRELNQIGAVVSNHPDEMYRDKYNPDLANYNVTKVCCVDAKISRRAPRSFSAEGEGVTENRDLYPNH